MPNKRDKFVELAEARTSKALKDIQLIGNLSNRSAYEYGDEDVRKIFKALQQALDQAKQRFSGPGSSSAGSFKL